MNRTRRTSRGHASIEYVLLAGLIAGMLGMGFTLPTAFADLLMTAESNMNAPENHGNEGGDAVADAGDQGGEDDGTGSGGFDDDDPWSGGNSGCNQGVGNGGEGCDPGNSNNTNSSNDEDGGSPGNPGRGGGNANGNK